MSLDLAAILMNPQVDLNGLLNENAFRCFVRIHRSFAVQKNFVTRVGTADVDVQGRTLPVGRTYKDTLDELVR